MDLRQYACRRRWSSWLVRWLQMGVGEEVALSAGEPGDIDGAGQSGVDKRGGMDGAGRSGADKRAAAAGVAEWRSWRAHCKSSYGHRLPVWLFDDKAKLGGGGAGHSRRG